MPVTLFLVVVATAGTPDPKVKIDDLHVKLIQLNDAYRLDVEYRIEVKHWRGDLRFDLKMHLIPKETKRADRPTAKPAASPDGEELRWCVRLAIPTKKKGDKVEWDKTFRVKFKTSKSPEEVKAWARKVKFHAEVRELSGSDAYDSDVATLHFKKLEKRHKVKSLNDVKNGRGLLVILPGITGASRDQRKIRDLIENPGDKPSTGLVAQIWDWTELAEIVSLGLRERAMVSTETDAAAILFANEVEKWCKKHKGTNKDKRKQLYLLCGSGGASLALLAANHLPDQKIFERVVFASAAVSVNRPLEPLTSRIEGKLYNYYSHQDYILVGIATSFFGTFKYQLSWPAAGRFGYRDGKNAREGIEQLGWLEIWDKETKNRGGHLDCYKIDYFEEFFLPLFCDNENGTGKKFCANLNIPDRWTKAVDPSYPQTPPTSETCAQDAP